jgi:hypothetical protein
MRDFDPAYDRAGGKTSSRQRARIRSALPQSSDVSGARQHFGFVPMIGIGGSLAAPPLPHHLAYGSVPRRFEKLG